MLVFELDGQRCALPAADVREIVRAVATTRLPKAPPIVEGVINLRGTVVPVLNIRQRFRLPPKPLHPAQHFIVACAGARLVALRVDRAADVVSVPLDTIESATRVVPAAEYLSGVATLSDGLLVIHDLEGLLSLDEGVQVDAAVVEAGSLEVSPVHRTARP